jgi:YD repeat-containing protein
MTEPSGFVTYYTYNARGNVATVTPENWPTWTYTYDTNFPDHVASVTSSSPSQWAGWRYAYNTSPDTSPGALKTVSRIGSDGVAQIVASYTYNARGRVMSAADASGRYHVYLYNAAGDVTYVSNGGSGGPGFSYEYDGVGRVTKVTSPRGNAITYTYDPDDRVKTMTPPSPGSSPALDFTTSISYDNYDAATGLVNVATTGPNGHTSTRGYDALSHLVRSVDALGNMTQYMYQYNLLHSIVDANSNATS